ncbi:hypothetical protein [Mariniblastus fucicola]|uniref:Transmembrane protein n=1 Tax=Mariniblastus fucicola TaxID=980251 RepID=A0A5B9P9C4_9BACT|nr:hypothetical protein [Mariniblastus fucicola]QEG22029.1 hypothetical protein MFFC18_18900 [Mariniblastus fucicola]
MNNELKPNDAAPTPPIVLIAVGFLVGAVVVGACWLSSRTTESHGDDIVRNVTVDYMYETGPSSASGSEELAVDSIEFLPGYVVMTDNRGRTQLLALNRLRKFNYWPSDK